MSTFSNIDYDDVFTSTFDSYPTATITTSTSSNNIYTPLIGNWTITPAPTTTPYLTTGTDTIYIDNTTTPLKVHGDAEIAGKLKVNGKDIGSILENIEKRLAILHPNTELEKKWEELKSLGEMYRKLEAEILEKEKIYNILQE